MPITRRPKVRSASGASSQRSLSFTRKCLSRGPNNLKNKIFRTSKAELYSHQLAYTVPKQANCHPILLRCHKQTGSAEGSGLMTSLVQSLDVCKCLAALDESQLNLSKYASLLFLPSSHKLSLEIISPEVSISLKRLRSISNGQRKRCSRLSAGQSSSRKLARARWLNDLAPDEFNHNGDEFTNVKSARFTNVNRDACTQKPVFVNNDPVEDATQMGRPEPHGLPAIRVENQDQQPPPPLNTNQPHVWYSVDEESTDSELVDDSSERSKYTKQAPKSLTEREFLVSRPYLGPHDDQQLSTRLISRRGDFLRSEGLGCEIGDYGCYTAWSRNTLRTIQCRPASMYGDRLWVSEQTVPGVGDVVLLQEPEHNFSARLLHRPRNSICLRAKSFGLKHKQHVVQLLPCQMLCWTLKTAPDATSCPCEEDTLSNELGTLWQEGNCKLESRLPSRWQHLVDCITQDNLHQGHFKGFEPTRLGLQIVSSEVWLTTNREDLDYRKAAILTLSRTDSAHIRHSLAGTCDSNLAVSVLPQSNKVHQPSWAPASLLKESADMSVWTIPNLSPATESRACLGLVTCGAFYRRTITAFCCLNDRGTEASGQLEGSLGGPSAGATGLPAPAPDWRRAEMAERLLPSGLSATKEVWLAWLVTVLMTLLAVSVVKAAVFGLTEGDLASLAGAGMSVLVGSGLVTYQVYSARLEGPE